MIVMNIAATYTTLTPTFWLTRLIIIWDNAAQAGFLPHPRRRPGPPGPGCPGGGRGRRGAGARQRDEFPRAAVKGGPVRQRGQADQPAQTPGGQPDRRRPRDQRRGPRDASRPRESTPL